MRYQSTSYIAFSFSTQQQQFPLSFSSLSTAPLRIFSSHPSPTPTLTSPLCVDSFPHYPASNHSSVAVRRITLHSLSLIARLHLSPFNPHPRWYVAPLTFTLPACRAAARRTHLRAAVSLPYRPVDLPQSPVSPLSRRLHRAGASSDALLPCSCFPFQLRPASINLVVLLRHPVVRTTSICNLMLTIARCVLCAFPSSLTVG